MLKMVSKEAIPRKAVWILILCSLIVALVTCALIRAQFESLRTSAGTEYEPALPIVVARKDLSRGTKLDKSHLELIPWTSKKRPDGFFPTVEAAVERVLAADIVKNEPILERKVAPRGTPAGLVSIIEPGKRAVSVPVNQVSSVAGFATPGTHVDVLMVAGSRQSRDPVAKIVLQNVPVLTAGQQIEHDREGKPVNVQTVTLLVSPKEAERLAVAANEGKIQLALRNAQDAESENTPGAPLASLMGSGRTPEKGRRIKPKPVSLPIRSKVEIFSGLRKTVQEF